MKKKNKSLAKKTVIILLIAIVFVLVIITFGWFVKDKQIEGKKKDIDEEIRETETRVKDLEKIKAKLEQKQKLTFFLVRLMIGILFIALDFLYILKSYSSLEIEKILNSILIINSAVLMGYSLIAFVSYGTISNFANALKRKYAIIFNQNHIASIEELQSLETKLKSLKNKRDEIEKEKEQNDNEVKQSVKIVEDVVMSDPKIKQIINLNN